MVESRCAMTSDVREDIVSSSARWTAASLSASRCAVASSSTTKWGDLRSRRANATRCFSPPAVSYTHLRAHETDSYLVCRLLLEKKKIARVPLIEKFAY